MARDPTHTTTPEARPRAWAAPMSVALGLGLGFFVLSAVVEVLSVGLVSGYQNTVGLLRQKAEPLIAPGRIEPAAVAPDARLRPPGRHTLRGRSEELEVFELEETAVEY